MWERSAIRLGEITVRRFQLLTLLVVMLAAPAWPTAPGAGAAAPSFVGLGDSWAAGPIIPLYEAPYGCLKSTNNYAHLAAPRLGLPLRDASCSGGETEDMTAPQGVTPGPNPPQFDRLDADTAVVTLLVGGNDIGFSSIAQGCASPTPLGQPCQDRYIVNGHDTLQDRIDATGPLVGEVIEGIKTRSPNAAIFVLNYAAIFPHTPGPLGDIGCYPQIPVAHADVPYLRSVQVRLNDMLATQAAAHGVQLIDVYAASVGNDACQPPGLRWIEPAVPASPAAPVHPNLVGMLAMADLVVAAAS